MALYKHKNIAVFLTVLCLCLAVLAIAEAARDKEGDIDTLKKRYARPADIPYPQDNPYSEAKAVLGKILFFDPRLSASGTQSCATCHNPALGWEDGMALGTGDQHKKLDRTTPTILNLAWDQLYFWDGRADSLEAQASMPIQSHVEMNMTETQMIKLLEDVKEYQPLFKAAFPEDGGQITKSTITKAIATFERGVVSGKAPFDRWIEGDEAALSEPARRGFALFNGKANCSACHSGWQFSDGSFHDTGLNDKDVGRGKLLPQLATMQQAFKTVGLRNIARRAPYMHNGSLKTLEEVIDHYDKGFVQRDSLSEDIKALHLTAAEKADLIAFLDSLTSEDSPVEMPMVPK